MRVQLNAIKQIREDNNTLWMQILRIALENSPDETKAILSKIKENDLQVTLHVGDIINED